MHIRENVPLARLPRLAWAGPRVISSKRRRKPRSSRRSSSARARRLPLFVLGGGSNLVVADAGFDGLVLKIGIVGVSHFTPPYGGMIFIAGAGCDWDAFVAQTVEAELRGAGMPQRNSRDRRRHARAERRRLWAGCFRGHQRSPRARSRVARDRHSLERRVPLRLSLQPLQHDRPRTLHRAASRVYACDQTAGRRSVTPTWRSISPADPASRLYKKCETPCARSATARRC